MALPFTSAFADLVGRKASSSIGESVMITGCIAQTAASSSSSLLAGRLVVGRGAGDAIHASRSVEIHQVLGQLAPRDEPVLEPASAGPQSRTGTVRVDSRDDLVVLRGGELDGVAVGAQLRDLGL